MMRWRAALVALSLCVIAGSALGQEPSQLPQAPVQTPSEIAKNLEIMEMLGSKLGLRIQIAQLQQEMVDLKKRLAEAEAKIPKE